MNPCTRSSVFEVEAVLACAWLQRALGRYVIERACMIISIYYTARRETPLSDAERLQISCLEVDYSANENIDAYNRTREGHNWESFCIYTVQAIAPTLPLSLNVQRDFQTIRKSPYGMACSGGAKR